MCKMQETRYGVFVRDKAMFYVEVEACRSDNYKVFVEKAAKKCKMTHVRGKFLQLFKMNGAQILNEEMKLNGKCKPWTLGNYLLLMKKSPSNVKLGIGQVSVISSSDCGRTEEIGKVVY